MELFESFKSSYAKREQEVMSLTDYLELCKTEPLASATSAERMVAAIGEPEVVDTSSDERLGRIFGNRTIRLYPSFSGFYGLEDTIERIVGYYRHAAQGLEERRQVLYLLGPVGGGKSSLAERLKDLMEVHPIYVLAFSRGLGDKSVELSPVFESPLGLFRATGMLDQLEKQFGVSPRKVSIPSPWALKRLDEANGDLSKFTVVKVYPSKLRQVGICKTEPGDENNQDISTLVGKVDIRKLEKYSQNDTDAYSYSGGLCRSNQGLLEFVEMFKAPIKVLHPLLTATQEGNYVGTESLGPIPFQGLILAHSNEAEWQAFRSNKNNEAFLDRICVVTIPYCLRVTEEVKIYKKLISDSGLSGAPCSPETLDTLARFSVMTRLKPPENSNIWSKMRIYDGENLKDTDPKAKSLHEYREAAGLDEGMTGISTRFAYKVLSATFNHDPDEVAADPVFLMIKLEDAIRREQYGDEQQGRYLDFIKSLLQPRYADFIRREIQQAYVESYAEYGQNMFDRYIAFADAWIEEQDFKDPDTGQLMDRTILGNELSKIEKPAGISNPKDFRNEVVKFVLRARANRGANPDWRSYRKLSDVIEARMFSQIEEILPVIKFETKKDAETAKKHLDFVERMVQKGYTKKQVRRLVDWFVRITKSG